MKRPKEDREPLGGGPPAKRPPVERGKSPPIRFQLLNVYYEPRDDHRIYLEGRSKDPRIGGVCAMTHFQSFLYVERRTPFRDDEDVKTFLAEVQRHIYTIEGPVTIDNSYHCDSYKDPCEFTDNLYWDKRDRSVGAAVALADFCTGFVLEKGKRKTLAHYTPPDEYLTVVKVMVRHPYMAKSLHLYFESNDYMRHSRLLHGGGDGGLVRTYWANADVGHAFCLESGLRKGKWCTLENYEILSGRDRRAYKKTNLSFDVKNAKCDLLSVESAPLRIMSFDCEMASKKDPETGKYRFCRPLAYDLDEWGNRRRDSRRDSKRDGEGGEEEDEPDPEKEDVQDADPVIIICALVFVDRGGELEFEQGTAFYIEHPAASEPTRDVKAWMAEALGREPSLKDVFDYWGYEKIAQRRMTREISMIQAFQDYLHDSDIDILTGWNIDSFDLPYLYKRWQWWKHVKGLDCPPPNFGALINGKSDLRPFFGNKKKSHFKAGGSAKGAKTYDSVTVPHYVLNDGLVMWRTDHAKEKPHSLDAVSQRHLDYKQAVVKSVTELVTRRLLTSLPPRSPSESATAEGEEKAPTEGNGVGSDSAFDPASPSASLTLEEVIGGADPETLARLTFDGVGRFVGNEAEAAFPMKKVQFDHSRAMDYWEMGGKMMLKFIMYCVIDAKLPPLLLKGKGKIQSQLSFSMVSGVNFGDVASKGQQSKVYSAIYAYCHRLHGGAYLVHDKGYHHYHWPMIFIDPCGPAAAVRKRWKRLQPFYDRGANQGGKVQPPALYGLIDSYVTTDDAASMYPSIIRALRLCYAAFLTADLIAHYGVPRYEYIARAIGSADKNRCGDDVRDHDAALELGCESDDLKVTFFHNTCDSILPCIVQDYGAERGKAKAAKAAWLLLWDHCKAAIRAAASSSPAALPRALSLTREITSEERGRLEALRALGKRCAKGSDERGAISSLLKRPKLLLLLLEICKDYVALPTRPEDVLTNAKCCLLKAMAGTLATSTDSTEDEAGSYSEVLRLSASQADNYEYIQLGVKVCMNSLYGVIMKEGGPLSCPETGATITGYGRLIVTLVSCQLEMQTSENAKQYLGLAGSSIVPVREILSETYSRKDGETLERLRVGVGEMLRKLPSQFVPLMKPWLTSEELVTIVYGDTDSAMEVIRKHSVVNLEQAFAVMKFWIDMINDVMPPWLKFEDEKVSECTKFSTAKGYDMMARMKVEKHKVKWMFAGSGKSDTLPFVTELLAKCKKKLMSAVASGRPTVDCVKYIMYLIKRRLLDFAMGFIPPQKLATTQRLTKYDPKATTQHAKVAHRMVERGTPVKGGDDVTYIYAVNTLTGEPVVESLDYVLSPESPLKPDLMAIWMNRVKSKISGYLQHLIAPLVDFARLDTPYEEEKEKNRARQQEQAAWQLKLVEELMYNGEGDIENRLRRRKAAEDDRIAKAAQAAMFRRGGLVSEGPITAECRVCYRFFKRSAARPREHVSVAYEERDAPLLRPTSSRAVCDSCRENATEHVTHNRAVHEKRSRRYFELRARCETCIAAPLVPGDDEKPDTPESCTSVNCEVYKKKSRILDSVRVCEENLLALGFRHTSW
jgi:DNA polymerase elongation subunit (family B)